MHIRESQPSDISSVSEIHIDAFGEPEGPAVAGLAQDILQDDTALPLLSLVAEENEQLIGNVIFSTVIFGDSSKPPAFILAPLAVCKASQNQGIGKILVTTGIEMLKNHGAGLVFVYGNPDYYSRFGFEPAMPHRMMPPYSLDYPEAWMVLELEPGALKHNQGTIKCANTLNSREYW